MEYKLGKANVVVDTLSRKAIFASLSQVTSPLLDRVKEGLSQETLAKTIILMVHEGKTQRFWLDDRLL